MCKRDIIIAAVVGTICFGTGIAVSPKRTGTPLDDFTTYLSGFHGDWDNNQGIKHVYFMPGEYNEVGQGLILDKIDGKWRIVGVEYVIGASQYEKIPAQQKEEWHSLEYAYKSGLLMAPNLGDVNAENLCRKLSTGYSKTIITWKKGSLIPCDLAISYGFDKDGEIFPQLIRERDKMLNISTVKIRNQRENKQSSKFVHKQGKVNVNVEPSKDASPQMKAFP